MPIVRFMPFICLGLLISCLTGCGKPGKPVESSAPPKNEAPSSMQLAIEGATGKTAIQAGNKAKAKIGEINAKQEEELKELDSF